MTHAVQAGASAGVVAAAATNPLDVVKTRLQTQHLAVAPQAAKEATAAAGGGVCARAPLAYTGLLQGIQAVWREELLLVQSATSPAWWAAPHQPARAQAAPTDPGSLLSSLEACGCLGAKDDKCLALNRQEGLRGFSRGMQARMLIHAPSVAICWTTYESVKGLLQRLGYF